MIKRLIGFVEPDPHADLGSNQMIHLNIAVHHGKWVYGINFREDLYILKIGIWEVGEFVGNWRFWVCECVWRGYMIGIFKKRKKRVKHLLYHCIKIERIIIIIIIKSLHFLPGYFTNANTLKIGFTLWWREGGWLECDEPSTTFFSWDRVSVFYWMLSVFFPEAIIIYWIRVRFSPEYWEFRNTDDIEEKLYFWNEQWVL